MARQIIANTQTTPVVLPADEQTFFSDLLTELKLPVTQANLDTFYDIAHIEGQNDYYNPINVVTPEPGSTDFNSVGVQAYPNFNEGVQGEATFLETNTHPQVEAFLQDLSKSDEDAALGDIRAFYETWGSDPGFGDLGSAGNAAAAVKSVGPGTVTGTPDAILTSSGSSNGSTSAYLTSSSSSVSSKFQQLSFEGTIFQYIDGFLNPKVSAEPSFLNLLTLGGANLILSDVVTLVDRIMGVVLGAGLTYFGVKALLNLNTLNVVSAVQRQQEIGIRRTNASTAAYRAVATFPPT